MAFSRQTAKKVRISELMSGVWTKKEGMEPSFVTTAQGEDVARARVLATIVAKFLSEDGNFGSVTLDDGTDTIRAKCFKELDPISKLEIGQLVDLTGKVREYNEEIYVMPEIIVKVKDPNWLLLRRLELLKGGLAKPTEAVQPAGQAQPIMQPADQPVQQPKQEERPADDLSQLRKSVLKMIEAEAEGLEFTAVMKKAGAPEAQVENVLNDLLSEGICYEPTPGKIKKI